MRPGVLRFSWIIACAVAVIVVAIFGIRLSDMKKDADLIRQELLYAKRESELLRSNNRQLMETLKLQAKNCGSELGIFSKTVIRKYSHSFVQVYALYKDGRATKGSYGTAGYLGEGYFLTSKHVVVLLPHEDDPSKPLPKVFAIKLSIGGKMVEAFLVDTGDSEMRGEVNLGDWAVIKVASGAVDSLTPISRFGAAYKVAPGEPLLRYGNDYDRGIVASTGLAGAPSEGGWFGWLVDGHPGYSGGGVLNLKEELIGLNGGILEGDNRMSVAIPVTEEMLRRLPEPLRSRLIGSKTTASDVASDDLLSE